MILVKRFINIRINLSRQKLKPNSEALGKCWGREKEKPAKETILKIGTMSENSLAIYSSRCGCISKLVNFANHCIAVPEQLIALITALKEYYKKRERERIRETMHFYVKNGMLTNVYILHHLLV